ncbi:mechanosensitive ion channel family protein [Catenovulum sp. 2E275]|uniref:mechanosensitive ion channel family protein n=1 Tax=Catenovulum sp. 2E275 TaxID=2980497 RepID=UPI0021CFD83A|nr:mechanosensitive ion channel family protein [Catenovulum sp. 2E275]MCU4677526.1 mechanosensitive ion channel family protein [Catenovulum sp. 2E275]
MLDLLDFLPTQGHAFYLSRIGVILAAVLFLSLVAFKFVLPVLRKAITKTNHTWDDLLIENKFISRVLLIVPVIAAEKLTYLLFDLPEHVAQDFGHVISIAITLVIASVILAIINTIRDIFDEVESLRTLPIDNIRQLAVLLVYLITTIFIVSIIFDKSPLTLLTGISAAMALVLLIFKDVILGFVAGVQLSLNRLVRVGDWIVFEKGKADGDVISVGLTVVKVRNFDKTITSIPVYDLVSNSFTNWRGMQETGARRIKRALYLDQNSVGYLTQENYEKLKDHPLLKQYLADKIADGASIATKDELPSNRCLSNLGTFRAYIEAYLKEKKEIRNDMLMMCRQLAPTEHGLPLELYCFTETEWLRYEKIQADVFDHLYCVAKYFGLRVFQFGELKQAKSA